MFHAINFTQDSNVFGRGVVHGGGGKAPKMQDNSIQLEQMRQAEAERQRVLQREEEQRQRELFTQRRNEAATGAQTTARSELTRRGLDVDRYLPGLSDEITRITGSIPDLDPNPATYFGPEFVEGVLNREQTGTRDRNERTVRGQFGSGFETSAIPDNVDDALLNSILEQQYSETRGGIDRARQSGQLTDQGYNAALSDLDTGKTGANTTLTGFGDTILNRYRGELTGIRDKAITGASDWRLGDADFNLDPYSTEYNTARTRQQGSLEGDIRNTVGSTKLFDLGALLDRGAKVGGPTNGDPGSLVASVLGSKKSTTNRGVGSTGVF